MEQALSFGVKYRIVAVFELTVQCLSCGTDNTFSLHRDYDELNIQVRKEKKPCKNCGTPFMLGLLPDTVVVTQPTRNKE